MAGRARDRFVVVALQEVLNQGNTAAVEFARQHPTASPATLSDLPDPDLLIDGMDSDHEPEEVED